MGMRSKPVPIYVFLPQDAASQGMSRRDGLQGAARKTGNDPAQPGGKFLAQMEAQALGADDPAQLSRWVKLTNLAVLQEACRAGHGVVLVCGHMPSIFALPLVLSRAGYDHTLVGLPNKLIYGMGLGQLYGDSLIINKNISSKSLFIGQLKRGKQVLARGGIVEIAADEYQGFSKGLPLAFLGRRREFKTGFAKLALSANAVVIPVSADVDKRGLINFRFHQPLQASGTDQNARVASLVEQFAAFLRAQWVSNLGDVIALQILKYLQLPRVDED